MRTLDGRSGVISDAVRECQADAEVRALLADRVKIGLGSIPGFAFAVAVIMTVTFVLWSLCLELDHD